MSRVNTKTVTKHYDNDTVNGWSLSYEYESENGNAPVEIKVTGQKGSSSLYINKSAANSSVNFSGGAVMDTTVITSVATECEAIIAGFNASGA